MILDLFLAASIGPLAILPEPFSVALPQLFHRHAATLTPALLVAGHICN